MKKFKLLAVLTITCSALFAQEKLNPLQAPTSPAATVLGLQPAAVLTPKSYDALETALYSNILDNEGGPALPSDFAIEFSPYWANDHKLSLEDYLFPKSFADKLIRNSSFSVATTTNFNLGDSSASNGIAFGYRCSFFFGSKLDRDSIAIFRDEVLKNHSIISTIGGQMELIDPENITHQKFIEDVRPILSAALLQSKKYNSPVEASAVEEKILEDARIILSEMDIKDFDAYKNKFYAIVDQHLNADIMFSAFKGYIRNRQGFRLDVAYANFLNFPTNDFAYSAMPKQTFWVTPSYRLNNKLDFIKVMGVLRYEWYNAEYYKAYFPLSTIYQNNLDYGIAISANAKRFSISLEIVGRSSNSEEKVGVDDDGNDLFRKITKNDTQYLGSFNFNLTDQILISYSLGNRFEPIANPLNTLVSMISLNFGFGAPSSENIY